MRKKFKISNFPKMALTILIKFCGFIVHSKHNNITLSAFPGKSLKLEKQFFLFSVRRLMQRLNQTDQSYSNFMFTVLLQLSPACSFHFRPTLNIKGTLMLRVVYIRDKKWCDKHDQLFPLLCYQISRRDRQESIVVISHLKSNAY